MESLNNKATIGRREFISFPKLGIRNMIGKIDTGAYTSCLHCDEITEKEGVLHFRIGVKKYKFKEYGQKQVKSSFGESEMRYIIKTLVKIGGKRINSVISLSDRSSMRYPVLIGRKLLKNKFHVDVSLLNHLHTTHKA